MIPSRKACQSSMTCPLAVSSMFFVLRVTASRNFGNVKAAAVKRSPALASARVLNAEVDQPPNGSGTGRDSFPGKPVSVFSGDRGSHARKPEAG